MNHQLINKAIAFISDGWQTQTLNLESVAQAAGFSLSFFDKFFYEHTGKTVMEFVRVYKMTQAACLLRTSDISVLDLALTLGYANPENFARAFKAIYTCSPREYRENHRATSLQWKDTTTGTVIKRFECEFPALKRVASDEFIDYLLTTDPLRHAFRIVFTPTIDHAVYQLSDDKEYILVEEYRPEEVALSLFCNSENIVKYINMAKAFPRCCIELLAAPDFIPPKLACVRARMGRNYAFVGAAPTPRSVECYQVRELGATDAGAVAAFAQKENEVLSRVFTHQMKNNDGRIQFLGLFFKDALVGCAVLCLEGGRTVCYSDISELFFAPKHDSKQNIAMLVEAAIVAGLAQDHVPMLWDSDMDSAMAEELGCKLISIRYAFDNFT
ncbi:MAG: helix-turn-helix transcriptional regulator [Oscillospiraceae bacterium]|nr:helix-turn-helix transcriptional regulator [Oscillospiraceae bacterium]